MKARFDRRKQISLVMDNKRKGYGTSSTFRLSLAITGTENSFWF